MYEVLIFTWKQLLILYPGPTDTAEVQDFEHAFKDLGRYVSIIYCISCSCST